LGIYWVFVGSFLKEDPINTQQRGNQYPTKYNKPPKYATLSPLSKLFGIFL